MNTEYPELTRTVDHMKEIADILSGNTQIRIEIVSSNSKLYATFILEQVMYDKGFLAFNMSSKMADEHEFVLSGYPILEFQSVLSIISPMLPRIKFLSENPSFITKTIVQDFILDLRLCEKYLTSRKNLTNYEISSDWNTVFNRQVPDDLFISVFPFRDSLYVTVYKVKRTDEPLRIMHSKASPFNFSANSVVSINNHNYLVEHSIVASQSQQFLAQVLRCLKNSIEDLETLMVLIPERGTVK